MNQFPQFILTVDAGHTRIKLALCEVHKNRLPSVLEQAFVDDIESIPWADAVDWMNPLDTIQVAGRVGYVTGSNQLRVSAIEKEWDSHLCVPLRKLQQVDVPIKNATRFPEKVGIDRLLTGVAVNFIRQENRPAIIVDSGTAVTVDYISRNGSFCGGAILPGLRLCAKALHEYTTSLPHYNAQQLFEHTPSPIGNETESAIASGLYWGHLGAIRELVSQYTADAERSGTLSPLLVFTGGASQLLKQHFPQETFLPDLSLQGLAITAQQLEAIRELS